MADLVQISWSDLMSSSRHSTNRLDSITSNDSEFPESLSMLYVRKASSLVSEVRMPI